MKKNNIIVALDIGTSKTVALVGDVDNYGEVTIVGYGEAATEGMDRGLITKPNEVIRSIKRAVEGAETTSGVRISSAIINVAGPHLSSQNEADFLTFGTNQKEIDNADITILTQKIYERLNRDDQKIIHVIPKRFILDDEDIVLDPTGFIGSKLEGEFHIVLNKVNALSNLKRVVEASGIKVIDFVANPVASATSVLYPEEKDMGVLVLDIGGGTTDVAVLKDGSFEHTKSIPIGGQRITLDIAHRFKIPKSEAEKLKVEHGLAITEAISDEEYIDIYPIGSDEPITISKKDLVETIELRLEEILRIVKDDLEENYPELYNKINGGIVLTGGVANTPYIKELAEYVFDQDVRIGKPKDYKGFSDKINAPEYATSVGIIQFKKSIAMNKEPLQVSEDAESDILKPLKDFFSKLKKIF